MTGQQGNRIDIRPAAIGCAAISLFYVICYWIYHFQPVATETGLASRLYTIVSMMPVTGYLLLAVFFFSVMLANPKQFELPRNMFHFSLIWAFMSIVGILGLYLFAAVTFFTFAPLLMKYGPPSRDIRMAVNAGVATLLWGIGGGYAQFRMIAGIFAMDAWTRSIWRNGMIAISLVCVFLPMPFIVFKWFGWDVIVTVAIVAVSMTGWFRLLDKTKAFPCKKRLPGVPRKKSKPLK